MKVFRYQDDWAWSSAAGARAGPKPGRGRCCCQKAASLNYPTLVVPMRGYGSHTGTLPADPAIDGGAKSSKRRPA